jgi:shikimate kinase
VGSRRNQARNIVLSGFHGCGKTSVGWELAKQLRRQFVDVPQELSKHARSSFLRLPQWRRQPEPEEIERRLVVDLAKRRDLVIALGADSLDDEDVRAEIAEFSFLVFLDPPFAALQRRLELMPDHYELMQRLGSSGLEEMLKQLRDQYEECDLQITEDLPPKQLARLIVHCFYT